MKLQDIKRMVKILVKMGKGIILQGSPGIGKSSVFKSLSEEEGWGLMVQEAPSLDPTDVRGLQALTGNRTQSIFTVSPLAAIDFGPEDRPFLYVIDELNSGLPMTQTALHSFFHPNEKRFGTFKVPKNVIPIGIGNLSTDGAGAMNLLSALADRVMVATVELSFSDWKHDYAIPKSIHPLVLGLLNFKPSLFNTFGEKKNRFINGKKNFVTPRTHTEISDFLYAASDVDDDFLFEGIANYSSEGVAHDYMAFKKYHNSLPDIFKIFDGEKIFSMEPGVQWAICAGLISNYGKNKQGKTISESKINEQLIAIAEYIHALAVNKNSPGQEYGMTLWMDLKSLNKFSDPFSMVGIVPKELIEKIWDEYKFARE